MNPPNALEVWLRGPLADVPDLLQPVAHALLQAQEEITSLFQDFPDEQLQPYGIEAIDPDTFVINQLDLDQVSALAAFKKMRARCKDPALTPEAFAAAFERAGLPGAATRLRDAAELI